ncbi:MAG: hypothetical protein KGZ58_07765 [Ignavibacteriales bacterium]|nr:hypothetical protein [Ignavibacteriales bacterium]
MKYSTIEKKYKNKWVLLECTKTTEDFKILDANVLASAKQKEELYEPRRKISGKTSSLIAIEYLGEIPEDIVLIM